MECQETKAVVNTLHQTVTNLSPLSLNSSWSHSGSSLISLYWYSGGSIPNVLLFSRFCNGTVSQFPHNATAFIEQNILVSVFRFHALYLLQKLLIFFQAESRQHCTMYLPITSKLDLMNMSWKQMATRVWLHNKHGLLANFTIIGTPEPRARGSTRDEMPWKSSTFLE